MTWMNASTASRTAYFEVYLDTASQYRWRMVAANGQTIAASGESFYSKDNAKRAAENVKALAPFAEVLDA